MILIVLEFFSQACSTLLARVLMMFSKLLISDRLEVSRLLMEKIAFLINAASSLLFLTMDYLDEVTLSLTIEIVMVRRAWLDVRHQFRYIEWLFNSNDPLQRNIRSMTKFESLGLSKYLVGTWLVRINRLMLNKSAITIRSSLMVE